MAISDLIMQLQHAKAPDRDLDISIGIVMGYKKEEQTVTKPDTGDKSNKVVWRLPPNGKAGNLPRFTEKLDDAYLLAQTLVPKCIGGVSWDARGGSARLDDGPYFTAVNPAIALCIAALSVKHFQQVETQK